METKKLLTEENYQKGKNKIKTISLTILTIGLIIGIGLITTGILKSSKIGLEEKLNNEEQKIITKKSELEDKIKPIEDQIKKLDREEFTGFDDAYYEREDKIEELEKSISNDKKSILIIDNALDEGFNYCSFQEAKNNVYTKNYCILKNKMLDENSSLPFYMIGAFIIIVSSMISLTLYSMSKGREISAFMMQQSLPLAKEGLESIAPTIGKVEKDLTETMAPAYGKVAKEISKGIKEGLKDDKE